MINERLQKMNREQFFAEEDKKKKSSESLELWSCSKDDRIYIIINCDKYLLSSFLKQKKIWIQSLPNALSFISDPA